MTDEEEFEFQATTLAEIWVDSDIDFVITSYTAHGLTPPVYDAEARKTMYAAVMPLARDHIRFRREMERQGKL